MKTLRECIAEAEANHVAIGHFNISDSEQLHAIFAAAQKLNVPVIIGTSEGEREFVGPNEAVALVRSLRETNDYPIFLNADHTYSVEKAKEAIDAGYDAVIFDGAKLSYDENVAKTKEIVEYARAKSSDIVVEGELGYIGTSSKILDKLPEGVAVTREMMTKPDELATFVRETGVDLVAPAVGNLHGMLKSGNPALDIELVRELRERGGVPMVLHGGSGISDSDFRAAINVGIAIVHINTEIRVAYRDGIKQSLESNAEEIAPYRFMEPGVAAVEAVVEQRLRLFNNLF